MKHILILASASLILCSCDSPQAQAKANAIIDRALSYGVAKGKIKPEEAALVQDIKGIALTSDTTSTK